MYFIGCCTYPDPIESLWLVVEKCHDAKSTVFWDAPISLYHTQKEADEFCSKMNKNGFCCCVYCVPFDVSLEVKNA